jgi:hypothetical protein
MTKTTRLKRSLKKSKNRLKSKAPNPTWLI